MNTQCQDCEIGWHDTPHARERCACACCHPDPYAAEKRAGMRADLLEMAERACTAIRSEWITAAAERMTRLRRHYQDCRSFAAELEERGR